MSSHEITDDPQEFDAHVLPDYSVQVDMNRKYVDVSDAFCNLLGYSRKELIGKRFDEVTAPRTNDISIVFELFLRSRYMHGIWIFLNRSQTTRIIVRYEAWLREDRRIECNMGVTGYGRLNLCHKKWPGISSTSGEVMGEARILIYRYLDDNEKNKKLI